MTDAFTGKTWWIIGASEGLGAALAQAIDARGASVILSARSGDKLTQLATTLNDAQVLPMDVTDTDSVNQAAAQARHADAMLYCVGTYEPMDAKVWEATAVEHMIDTNFTGAARVLADVVPHYVTRGSGHIMLIGSLSGYRGLPAAVGYSASKAAVIGLTKSIAADFVTQGVRCNAICPGYVLTPLVESQIPDTAKKYGMTEEEAKQKVILERQPSKEFATVEQLGGTTVFLCSDAAAQITGTTISVDGGWTAL